MKRDKSLCWKCKYHTYLGNISSIKASSEFEKLTPLEVENIACYYSVLAGSSALRSNGKRETVDLRGEGPGCKLFEEGQRDIAKARRDFTSDVGMRRGRIDYGRQ